MIKLALSTFTLSLVILASGEVPAFGQTMRPFERPAGNRLYQSIESRPTVSPYVNLANNNGLTNYQSLVRPLIEEREELNRQWTALERLNQHMYGPTEPSGRPSGVAGPPNRTPAVRYMHYSHYFGTNR